MEEKAQNRLNELAVICKGSSICTAFTFIENKFLISANEFNIKMRGKKNKKLNHIVSVFNHFKKIATGMWKIDDPATSNSRMNIVKANFLGKLHTEWQGAIKIQDQIVNKFCLKSMIDSTESPIILMKEKMPTEQDFEKGLICIDHMRIDWNRIRKVENAIVSAKQIFNPSIINAFRTFNFNPKTFKESPDTNILVYLPRKHKVHAEIQLVDKILDNLGWIVNDSENVCEIPIVTALKTCWDCTCYIDAVNEIMEKRNIKLRFKCIAGAHSGSFGDNWCLPKIYSTDKSENQLKDQIFESYDIRKKSPRPEKYSINIDSDCSAASLSPMEQLNSFSEKLSSDLLALKRRGLDKTEEFKLLEFGEKISRLPSFSSYWEPSFYQARDHSNNLLDELMEISFSFARNYNHQIVRRFWTDKNFCPDYLYENLTNPQAFTINKELITDFTISEDEKSIFPETEAKIGKRKNKKKSISSNEQEYLAEESDLLNETESFELPQKRSKDQR